MTPFVKGLLALAVCLIMKDRVGANSLDKRTSFAKRANKDTYYNIYTKINALEKDLKNLKTRLQKKNKLLRQVLQSVIEMDSNLELPDKNLKKQTNLASKKNVGFTTRLKGTTYSSTSSIIQGNTIFYNGGNAYNGTVFTSPSPGLYLFSVSVITNTKNSGIRIFKNSKPLTLAYPGYDNPQYKGASVSAALWLDVGDQVYICPYGSSLLVNGESVFTGVKVN
ncbi:uncharacterized protein LOC111110909 isoform X2 [Crassostrea virginica]